MTQPIQLTEAEKQRLDIVIVNVVTRATPYAAVARVVESIIADRLASSPLAAALEPVLDAGTCSGTLFLHPSTAQDFTAVLAALPDVEWEPHQNPGGTSYVAAHLGRIFVNMFEPSDAHPKVAPMPPNRAAELLEEVRRG